MLKNSWKQESFYIINPNFMHFFSGKSLKITHKFANVWCPPQTGNDLCEICTSHCFSLDLVDSVEGEAGAAGTTGGTGGGDGSRGPDIENSKLRELMIWLVHSQVNHVHLPGCIFEPTFFYSSNTYSSRRLNQPIWKNMRKSKSGSLSQFSGWK